MLFHSLPNLLALHLDDVGSNLLGQSPHKRRPGAMYGHVLVPHILPDPVDVIEQNVQPLELPLDAPGYVGVGGLVQHHLGSVEVRLEEEEKLGSLRHRRDEEGAVFNYQNLLCVLLVAGGAGSDDVKGLEQGVSEAATSESTS